MRARVGTSGFSYVEWKGRFYAEKTKSADMLSAYAARLGTVEINNTFYRLPKSSVVQGWADKTPPGFLFSIKASRRITHFQRLASTDDLLGYLAKGLAPLSDRLGPVLFQLPPTLKSDQDRLSSFLKEARAHLGDARIAMEFRHPSWFDEGIYQVLRDFQAAMAGGDGDDGDRLGQPLVVTAPYGYVRLREEEYSDEGLTEWAERLSALGLSELFVYFKHETEGPYLAERLQALLDAGS